MKAQIEFEKFEGKELDELKKIAISNNRKLTKQSLTELAFEISYRTITVLDSREFENIIGFKYK
jgi:hypothetical protein